MKSLIALALLGALTVQAQIPSSAYGPSVVPSVGAPSSSAPQGSGTSLQGASPSTSGAFPTSSPATSTSTNFGVTPANTNTTLGDGTQNPTFNPNAVLPGNAPADTTMLTNQPATNTTVPPTTPSNNPIPQAQELQPLDFSTQPNATSTGSGSSFTPTDVSGTPVQTFPSTSP